MKYPPIMLRMLLIPLCFNAFQAEAGGSDDKRPMLENPTAEGAPIPFIQVGPPAGSSSITASVVLRVSQQELAIEELLHLAKDAGGYLSSRSNNSLVLRIPATEADVFLATAETVGRPSERTYEAKDLSPQLREKEARLNSRREVMERYFDVLEDASTSGALQIQAELSRIIGEVERLEGELRLLRHQLAMAEIQIAFRFEDRRRPVSTATTSFDWINDMNLGGLMVDFRGRTR